MKEKKPGTPHHLAVMLPGWRWLADPSRGVTVLLHRRGRWLEVDDKLRAYMTEREARAVATTLIEAVNAGHVGESIVELTEHSDGTLTGRVVSWSR